MNIKLDENGITIATLPELIETLIAEFKTIYGSDINLSQDTPDGQRVAIYSRITHECLVLVKKLYQNLKPEQAEGLHLDYLARINGLLRKENESDSDLRRRRLKTFENASQSTIGGIAARLNLVKGVTDAVVYENTTNESDTLNIPPHSIWVVVEGGENQAIVDCLACNKTGGTGLKGTIKGKYIDKIVRSDGTFFDVVHEYRFDRPKITEINIKLTATREKANEPVPIQEIKDELVKSLYRIGENIKVTALYCILNRIARSYYISDLQIAKDGNTWTSAILNADVDEKFTIVSDNIAVNEVIT
ncbi:hypothetical protein QE197_24220 (plasmid) [Arsenophonus nasoniae]|uniref:Baseplate J-like protein n=1 Tax=Arsenophonus nasoniae TaxID=638 RepID=A0A4P7LAM9_9GAMM|nr:hypothetical protein [Arsenophonus nasoniae]QBY46192.1 hypothetical protein ArsFIN_48030 [Arsenophonus nasoniae]WGM08923.1 hypothetical protein QE258_26545 [Arsenophonus nasoniae]WGM13621.1 hypothetical protein QE197_24220 [Arsenophonus nasoniae]WGM18359.1 hypothetical protein QE193_24460 [Arsenophonus nasoniae]